MTLGKRVCGWPAWVAGADSVLADKFAVVLPHLDERQRRVVSKAVKELEGRLGSRADGCGVPVEGESR